MTLRIWPKDFERKNHITKEEKALLRNASQNLRDGHFVVGVDPVGMSSAKVHMGFYIAPNKGLLTYSIYTDLMDENLVEIYKNYVLMVECKIHARLLDSKMLIVRNGEKKALKFPYRHVIIFANEKPATLGARAALKELEPYAYVQFLNPIGKRQNIGKLIDVEIANDCRVAYDQSFTHISEQECKAIFERLAPEYTVVIHEQDPVEVKQTKTQPTEQDFRITGKELEYKTFFLDEYQVALVNDMGKGHRVLLANPGAGKSVLLLSKAFKFASL